MKNIPKIKDVKPLENYTLQVLFSNGIIKKYDMKPIIKKYPVFEDLQHNNLFKIVHVDCGGYGIAWNDNLDLSEYEIWKNGIETSS